MAQTKGEFDPPLLTLERVLPVATVIYAASVGGPGIVNVDASKAHRELAVMHAIELVTEVARQLRAN
jgi:hypothetical protein